MEEDKAKQRMSFTKLSLPYIVGDYTMTEMIGSGGFSSVYHCVNRVYNCDFAAKVAYVENVEEQSMTEYNAEVKNLMCLNHPNVIKLYDAFNQGNLLFMIFEYCPNGTLEQMFLKGEIAHQDVNFICQQIVSSLYACHTHNIAHRDLKLSNVLIDNYGRPKLADFGLSAKLRDGNLVDDFTASFCYAPPEVFMKAAYDPFKADIWSLGIMFYILGSGALPWPDRGDYLSTKNAIMIGSIDYPKSMNKELVLLLRKMLVVNSSQRITIQEVYNHPYFRKPYKLERRSSYNCRVTARRSKKQCQTPENNTLYFSAAATIQGQTAMSRQNPFAPSNPTKQNPVYRGGFYTKFIEKNIYIPK